MTRTWPIVHQRVAERLGLDLGRLHPTMVTRALNAVADDLGLESTHALMRLLTSEPNQERLWPRLAARLTVQKSGFFRDQQVFEALAVQHLLPLIARRAKAGQRRLRLWSAGTATGDEAYSLSILLDELIGDLDLWDIAIVGSDLSEDAVKAASLGIFGAHVSKELSADRFRRHFVPHDGNRFEFVSATRGTVRFEIHNLLSGHPLALGEPPYDLILCRNTLMYLSPDAQAAATKKFGAMLGADGVLVLGPAEASLGSTAGLSSLGDPSHAIYRTGFPADQKTKAVVSLSSQLNGGKEAFYPAPVLRPQSPAKTTSATAFFESAPAAEWAGDRSFSQEEQEKWRMIGAEAEEGGDFRTAEMARRFALKASGGASFDRFLLGSLLMKRGKRAEARDILVPLLSLQAPDAADERLQAAAYKLLQSVVGQPAGDRKERLNG
ncbi:CheR family methyltransferase [Oceanibaculum pacificum]|uniref:CheR-type methyltransferase domain-containing protein n=1 Tax=Oceanibaculum pacificum TaxID=580166 RepID=A0A154VYA8_9PROT|nr:protein-glutamate O-methyltransferase CheR [Oceanibaculum pacificum]KZD06199.1 hypothetical protein AUP43_11175 [Oceanibaculum pacificum]